MSRKPKIPPTTTVKINGVNHTATKDKIRIASGLYLEGTPTTVVQTIIDAAKDLEDPYITEEYIYGRYSDNDRTEYQMQGWRPVTDAEKALIKKAFDKERADKAAFKTATEERDRAQYEKLKQQFEGNE